MYTLGRRKWAPFTWYRGKQSTIYGHLPDDQLGPVWTPTYSVTFEEGTGGFCEDATFPVIDQDFWSAPDEECSAADKPFAMHVWKSFRSIQNDIVGLCSSFIEAKDWNESYYIASFVPATFFAAAGINSQTLTIGTVDEGAGTATVSGLVLPEGHPLPIAAYYAVINEGQFTQDDDGANGRPNGVLLSGATSIDDASVIPISFINSTHEGYKLVISFGWSRYIDREFQYMYPTQTFLPDSTPEDGVIDPAAVVDYDESACLGVGLWSKREASTHYSEASFTAPSATVEFVSGEYARWVGDRPAPLRGEGRTSS